MSIKKAMIVTPLIVALVYAVSWAVPPLRILRVISGLVLLTFIPGFAVYLLIKRSALEVLETITVSMAISPIVAGVLVSLLLIAGLGWNISIAVVMAICVGIVWIFAFKRVEFELEGNTRTFVILISVLLLIAVAASIFHISSAYYRMRSDAWHQGEMAYEILARGVPPLEPTYEGRLPQYYWLYEAYAAILHRATTLGPFEAMSIVSAQFLILAGLSIYLISGLFRKSFAQNISAVVFTILGGSSLGYGLWILRSLTGDVKMWEEISRNFYLINGGVLGTTAYVNSMGGVAWIVAKYMHSNPMVIGSVLFMLLVYFILGYISDRKASWLLLSFVSLVGVLLIHAISGIAFMVICGPAAFLVYLVKRRSPDLGSFKPILAIYAVFLLALIVSIPYLYPILGQRAEVQSMQQGGGILSMLGNPVQRLMAIGASSLVFIPLAIPSIASLFRKGSVKSLFFLLMIACMLLYTLLGPGTYHVMRKFYFYSYVFLAIMGSWTIPVVLKRFWTGSIRRLVVVLLMAIIFLPTPAILVYGWITDPTNTTDERDRAVMKEKDKEVYRWIRENTPIDAFIVDNKDRTFVLVFGQRRTYQYVSDYKLAWRQDERERANRSLVMENIYSQNDLEPFARERLQAIEEPVYVLVRKEDFEDQTLILDKIEKYPGVFERVYGDDESAVYRVIKSWSAE